MVRIRPHSRARVQIAGETQLTVVRASSARGRRANWKRMSIGVLSPSLFVRLRGREEKRVNGEVKELSESLITPISRIKVC